MKKGAAYLFGVLLCLSVLVQPASAASNNSVKIALNHAYLKSNGTYTFVVKDKPNIRLGLYLDDKNPTFANVNKDTWATFRGIKFANTSGKISFTQVFKSKNKSVQKPIKYTRYYTAVGSDVSFSTDNPNQPKPAPTPLPPAPAPAPKAVVTPKPTCTNGSYVNSAGNTICSPAPAPSAPAGATAKCNDGTYSFSQTHSGTCSHHGGVLEWL